MAGPGSSALPAGLAAVLLYGPSTGALDEAGTLLAKVNPELPQPAPPAAAGRGAIQDGRRAARAAAALRGEDLEEQKRIVRSHFDKEPRTEKLPEVAQAFGLEAGRASTRNGAAGDGERPAPTLLLPGMARHLHEQRGVPLDPAKEVARLHQQLRGAPDDALVLAKLGAVYAELGQPGEAAKNLPWPSNGWALLAGDGGNTFLQAGYSTR